jgi:tRNA splicing ligase
MLNVQKFIATNGLDSLSEQFSIDIKKYENGYVKLNYSQIDSPKYHPICDECRGLVLQILPDNSSVVISRSFNRFYNFGEGDTKLFDFSDCSVYEKADGSLVMVSWSPVDNKWIIGTRGMLYAEGSFGFSLTAAGGTFYDWILKAMQLNESQFQSCMSGFSQDYTYVMEFCGMANRIVTPYSDNFMVLLAVVHNQTGAELLLN